MDGLPPGGVAEVPVSSCLPCYDDDDAFPYFQDFASLQGIMLISPLALGAIDAVSDVYSSRG